MATATGTKTNTGSKDTSDDKGSGKGSKKLLMIIAVVVLVALGAAGSYFFLGNDSSGPPPEPKPGDMVKMDTMTLSLADHHYLKLQVAVELVQGKATADTFPTVKASQLVIQTFSDREVSELSSNAARAQLKQQLLTGLQQAYPKEVYDVYLTQFVIQ